MYTHYYMCIYIYIYNLYLSLSLHIYIYIYMICMICIDLCQTIPYMAPRRVAYLRDDTEKIQIRLTWPLRRDDTHKSRNVNNKANRTHN